MKHSINADPLGSQFERFLYATIGASGDEMPVSVLSILARRDLDPWAEAAALARLPKASAITRLVPAVSAVMRNSAPLNVADEAAYLVALLPRSADFYRGYDPKSADPPQNFSLLIFYFIIGALVVISIASGV